MAVEKSWVRLAAGYREHGELSFAYFEFEEFPSLPKAPGFTRAKMLSAEDGVIVKEVDRFTYTVTFEGNDRMTLQMDKATMVLTRT